MSYVYVETRFLSRHAISRSPASVMDFAIIGAVYKGTYFLDALLRPEHIALPYGILYPAARFALWSLYTFIVGLFCTGLWVLAHECGHGAFSDSKAINNAVGWVLHSGYGAATSLARPSLTSSQPFISHASPPPSYF